MNTANWRESVVEYIRAEAQPVDKFGHQPRLYALATQIGNGMDYDDDVVFAAAWMHDLGVFLGHRPSDPAQLARWDHVPYTIARSRELLSAWGFPASKLNAVAESIRTHQPQDEPVLIEAIILRDADILEQLGAMGALRALVKIGRDTRYITYSDVLPVLERSVEYLPGKLRLVQSNALAVERIDSLHGLVAAIKKEAGALLY
ncbi:HD domain-containing protein [Terracidiphilus gabretensis]|uniref:HD domain-containing protein n=1 Tax=Terracidiphilus gabretensis TaxID=1577687 RepID=UPI00071B6B64|nr:HD domain-containing protein [Terracidiphilus gabretensis]